MEKSEWLGVVIFVGFSILFATIILNICGSASCKKRSCEGFSTRGPSVTGLPTSVQAKSDVAYLPNAPYTELPDIPRPAYDPAYPRTLIPQLVELKYAMDGFYERELPYILGTSDSSVQLPISQFKGNYETVKAELLFLAANEYNPPQLTVQDVETMGQNLRFLQKEARAVSPDDITEGFYASPSATASATATATATATPSSNKHPITFTELQTLSLKLAVEIARLTATGTTDPLINARVNIYTQMKNTVDSLIGQINNKTLDPSQIPIAQADYDVFLPRLGSNSAGPAGILFNSGSPMSSLFNSYQAGDVDGAKLASTLFNKYADSITQGLSYNVSLSYTSPNETTKEVAKSLYRGEFQNKVDTLSSKDGFDNDSVNQIFQTSSAPASASASASAAGSDTGSEARRTTPFDWKKKAQDLATALQGMGLEPGDFGCLTPGTQVSPDFSWRGNAKMICTRAAAHYDPALPEQIGCPPVDWPGWRS